MSGFILFLALVVVLIAGAYWMAYADTGTVLKVARRGGGVAVLAVAVVLAVTGRWMVALPLAWIGFTILRGGAPAGFGFPGTGRRSSGNRSQVRSRFFDMRLDHDSGELDGEILDGPHQGRMLGQLTQGELIALHAFIAGDDESTALLETYLDQRFPGWREATGTAGAEGGEQSRQTRGGAQAMSLDEAREVLGVAPNATAAEIRSAHRSRMKRAHPDRGGSTMDAARLNQARDVLLRSAGARR